MIRVKEDNPCRTSCEPWCASLATTTYSLIAFPQEDIVTRANFIYHNHHLVGPENCYTGLHKKKHSKRETAHVAFEPPSVAEERRASQNPWSLGSGPHEPLSKRLLNGHTHTYVHLFVHIHAPMYMHTSLKQFLAHGSSRA